VPGQVGRSAGGCQSKGTHKDRLHRGETVLSRDDSARIRPQGCYGCRMEDEGLGAGFWLKLFAVVLACGLAGLIFFLLMSRAVYRWGFLGGFLALALLVLLGGWILDRRNSRKLERLD
jgi:hypothetical protein